MIVRVQKWGNSLALRIPKLLASETNLKSGSLVSLSLDDGKLVISPVPPKYSLKELLSRISDANVHAEVVTGGPVGKELW
ncbi:MAG: AbrB/MazE/SpoVT family DNA-binding domain-containing protein [Bacillota bacterium]